VDWSKYLPITGIPAFFHGNVTPYSESYTLSIQRELWRNTTFTTSYVGTQAHHLLVLTSANPGNPSLCLSLSQPENVMPGTATCGPFGESGVYVTRDGKVIQGTRSPFDANFAAVTLQKTIGNSSYNALEVSLRHASNSLELQIGHIQQIFGSVFKSFGGCESAQSPTEPGAFRIRHEAQFRGKLQLEASLRGHLQASEPLD